MEEINQTTRTTRFDPWLVPASIIVGAVMISGSIMYSGAPHSSALLGAAAGTQPTAAPTRIQNPADLVGPKDPVLGNANAKVTIVEFSDFQCPFCRQFWRDAYVQIKKQYIDTGKARLVYRDYPLSIHPSSTIAALAGQCANEQGKFWQFHDMIFTQQDKSGPNTVTFGIPELKSWARLAGVNGAQFDQCLDSAKYKSVVDANTAAGNTAGVTGTPTFFINGQMLIGAQPFSAFQQLIDQALSN